MPKIQKHQKISKRLIVYIILFSSLITAIVTLIQIYTEYVEDKSLLDTNIRNINTGYREGITNAVWLDDKVQLASILDGVVALPDINYIEVRVKDEIYASRGSKVKQNSLSSSFPLYYKHDERILTIGKTYVQADLTEIYRRLMNHAWAILGLNAIKTFLVSIFMFFIFNRLVVTRLESLSHFVQGFDVHNINSQAEPLPLIENKQNDEISEIATALESMQKQLSHSIKELLGLKTTLDLSLDGVFMFRPDNYKIFYANAGASKLLGYTIDELMNLTPMDLSVDMTAEHFAELATSTYHSENQAMRIETHFRPKQGNPIPVRLLLQYLQPQHEQPRYVFIAHDISEHIKAENEIRTLLEETKAANTELESFSYSVSHDLRSPLRSIDGFCHLLLQDYGDKIDDEGQNYLHRVRKNAQHMGLLIDDMLSLSDVTRGELNRQTVNLSDMAEKSIKKLQDSEPGRKVSVTIAPAIYGWVDKSLFQNLLDNLLGNAWKYTSKTNNPIIEFGTIEQGDQIIYFVRDNGAGFDMQYADKLFHPFQRLHTEDEFEGTGIGLATVSRILSRHAGRAWAEGEIGKGACFYFTLGAELSLHR